MPINTFQEALDVIESLPEYQQEDLMSDLSRGENLFGASASSGR
jgi:hypothetical protein